jgi:hypothetical protein
MASWMDRLQWLYLANKGHSKPAVPGLIRWGWSKSWLLAFVSTLLDLPGLIRDLAFFGAWNSSPPGLLQFSAGCTGPCCLLYNAVKTHSVTPKQNCKKVMHCSTNVFSRRKHGIEWTKFSIILCNHDINHFLLLGLRHSSKNKNSKWVVYITPLDFFIDPI